MKRFIYKAVITLAAVAAAAALAGCDNQLLETVRNTVVAAQAGGVPTVIGTTPTSDQNDVDTTVVITATFEGAIDPATVTAETFLLKQGTVSVAGTVSFDVTNNRASFTPDEALDLTTSYAATLTTGVANIAGVSLASEHSWNFTTFDANPDEIVVNVSYGGPYEFTSQHPMWLTFLPHPWDGIGTDELPYEVKINGPGSVVVNVEDLPAEFAEDGTYWLILTHDLSGDYQNFYDGSSMSTGGAYSGLGDDHFTTNFFDVVVTYPSDAENPDQPYTVIDEAQMTPGNAYSVTFTGTELVAADIDEPNEDWRDAASFGSVGTAYTRTMGWDDTDWYSFVPTVTDEYRVVVATNPYNPDDETSLDLGFPVQLSVMVYDSGMDEIYHVNSDYDDAGTDADDYGLVDASLIAGETYLFRVRSTDKVDMGEYKIKVIPAEVDYDVDEPGNDESDRLGGTEIPFGHQNSLSRSLHKYDTDWFWIDATSLLLSNVYMTVETLKPSSETQDLDVQIGRFVWLEDSPGVWTMYHNITNYNGGFADLYYNNWPAERREIKVANQSSSSIDYYQPTGTYEIRFVYGPDYWDYDGVNDEPTAPGATDDTIGATADMDTVYSGGTSYHTIYRDDDVDFIRVWTGSFTYITVDLSVAETYQATGDWTDDFYAEMVIYNPDESPYAGGSAMSVNGEGSPQIYVGTMQNQYLYVKVYKASNSPIPTGAYKIQVTGS